MSTKNKLSNIESETNAKIKSGKIKPVHIPRLKSATDILKFQLCSEIIQYKKSYDLTQIAIAEVVGVNKSEMSKIFSYQLHEFSTDRLLGMIEVLIKSGADIELAKIFDKVKTKVATIDKGLKTQRIAL